MLKQAVFLFFALLGFSANLLAKPQIEAYGHLPSISFLKLSPSGKRYAFITIAGKHRQLGVASTDGKLLFRMKAGDVKVRNIRWVNDTRLLVEKSAIVDERWKFRDRYELWTVLNIDLTNGDTSAVFHNDDRVVNAVFGDYGRYHIGEEWDGFYAGITFGKSGAGYFFEHSYPDLYRVNFQTGQTALVDKGTSYIDDWLVSPDGSVAAYSEYDKKTGQWRLFAGDNRDKQLYQRLAPLGGTTLTGFGRSMGSALISYQTDDEDVLDEVSLSDGTHTTLLEDVNTGQLLRDPVSRLLLGAHTANKQGAVFFEPLLQARYDGARKAFPGYQMELVSFTHNLERMIVKTDGGDDSGTFWFVDISSGSAKPIGRAYPTIKSADVGPTQWFTYKATDGQEIEAVLTLPPGQKPKRLPLVVMPHGGPIGVRDRVGFDFWAQAYAASGYAVLQPNYRGSSGYGHAFREAGFGQWGRKMQTDLSDGVTALAAKGIIDPKRVCIVGGSYGGYAALAGVTLQHGVYRCAVSVAGVSDLPEFFAWEKRKYGKKSAVARFWDAAIGADKEGGATMASLSPARLAKNVDVPVLLIHGKDDTVVPLRQSELMADALEDADKQVEFEVMKGEDHWLSRDRTRSQMIKASVSFVRKHNPP